MRTRDVRVVRASHHLDMGLRYLDEAICEFCDSISGGTDAEQIRVDPMVMTEMNKILKPYGLAVVEKDSTTQK